MSDADMQDYYDTFFEEVFVETHDKVAGKRRSFLLIFSGWFKSAGNFLDLVQVVFCMLGQKLLEVYFEMKKKKKKKQINKKKIKQKKK